MRQGALLTRRTSIVGLRASRVLQSAVLPACCMGVRNPPSVRLPLGSLQRSNLNWRPRIGWEDPRHYRSLPPRRESARAGYRRRPRPSRVPQAEARSKLCRRAPWPSRKPTPWPACTSGALPDEPLHRSCVVRTAQRVGVSPLPGSSVDSAGPRQPRTVARPARDSNPSSGFRIPKGVRLRPSRHQLRQTLDLWRCRISYLPHSRSKSTQRTDIGAGRHVIRPRLRLDNLSTR